MTLAQIMAFLQPFEALLIPEIMNLEAKGVTELNAMIAGVSSPDLKALLTALSGAIDAFAKVEIQKM